MNDIKYQDIVESITSIKAGQVNENILLKAALPVAGAVGVNMAADRLEDEGIVPPGIARTAALGTLGVIGAEALKRSLRRSSMIPRNLRYGNILSKLV